MRIWLTDLLNILEDSLTSNMKVSIDDRICIPLRLPTKRYKSLHLSRNPKLVILDCPKQWFDAITITYGQEEILLNVVQTKRELPSTVFEKIEAVTLVKSKHKFAIRGALELVVDLLLHLHTQPGIVVELPIDNNMKLVI